ncbi:restriction endonuclease subunit S [Paracoccus sp. (in: a-proteobacteria)]|uniref:restriction endonuclease subunit S n=1 Tax=Paracoccus sp. TaxID=267 RepID=UPI0025840FF3|nr:restriction endonuclease subunit S [Paracoccus sp. (in: a-proteobacteria)]
MKAGWNLREIGEAFQTVTGNTPPKSAKHYYGNALPLVKPPELTDGDVGAAGDGLSDSGAQVARVAPEGSVLVSCIGNLGKIGLATRPVAFNQQINAIYPNPTLALPKFTFYQVMSPQFREQLDSLAAGTTVSIVNKSRFNSIKVPLPPLEEQQRIVAVLDEAFEGLARARAHAEANLQNARELFETSLSAFIDRHQESWTSTTLGEAYDVRDGTHDSPKYHPSGRALITSKNLGRDGLHFEKVKFISEEDYDSIRKRSGVDKGDVLLAMIGTIGNPIVVNVDPDFAIKNVALFKMKADRSGQFLRYILRSKQVINKMETEAKGTTQKFVGLGYLRSFPISLPEPTAESAMVAELDRVEAQCRSAESLYEMKLQDLDDLRHSLLQKAFAGELI